MTPRHPAQRQSDVGSRPAPPEWLRTYSVDQREILCMQPPFSSGTEGNLYFTRDGQRVVKIYTNPESWRQESLDDIIKKRATVLADHSDYWSAYFCWPEARIVRPGLGLVMRRASPDLRPFSHFLAPGFRGRLAKTFGPQILGSWLGHVGILIKLARTVNRLHQCGLCHSDLSPNNLLVNPQTGTATLIDCDGLVDETGSTKLMPTVLGTPDYMAPELVMGMFPKPGQPMSHPNLRTDLHSLAVLIYQGLLFRHPLRGGAIYSSDPDEDERLMLGARALYTEHPTNRANAPRKKDVLTSSILGAELRELFGRAFIDGLHHPEKRPQASEWERALVRIVDQTIPCSNPNCEAHNFLFVESARCPWCKVTAAGLKSIPILSFYRPQPDGRSNDPSHYHFDFRFVGWPGRKMHRWHIEPLTLPGPSVDTAPLAEIKWVPDGRNGARWSLVRSGIRQIIDATVPHHYQVMNQAEIPLQNGMRLKIPNGERSRVIEVRFHELRP